MYLCHSWHFSCFSTGLWNQVLYKVKDVLQYYKDIRSSNMGKNHPLINRKFAYWVDENTLCLGYTLKTNPNVFRPIYRPDRLKYMREMLPNIPIVVKKREKYLKELGHKEIFKLTKIPEGVINIIMDFV